MRLAYTSDLHADLCTHNAGLLTHLAAYLQEQAPDIFIIAGDLAETVGAVEASLSVFADVPGERLYLAGNHDLFAEGLTGVHEPRAEGVRGALTSQDKFETALPQAASRAGFRYLGLEPLRFGNTAIVGVPGWFDFTLRDPALDGVVSLQAYRAGQWRGTRAYDRGHVLWPTALQHVVAGGQPASVAGAWAGDEEILEVMVRCLESQLVSAAEVSHVVAVIHVLPFAELVRRDEFGVNGFFDAYLGSARLGSCLQGDARVRVLISGHQHRSHDRNVGRIRAVSKPLGDARKRSLPLDALARDLVGWIELGDTRG